MAEVKQDNNMLKVGTILHGTYKIERYLSSGGFGNTYVATNIHFGDVVAVKEFFMKGVSLRDSDNTTVSITTPENADIFEQQKTKFMKEARRLHNLKNEHIVRVHDLFEEFGTVYYVMDFIDGVSLREKLKEQGHPFSEGEALDILRQVLDALAAVHKLKIYHLDLKPANIMLEDDDTAKLIDFGASKQLSQDEEASTSTGVSYTNGYAPNEQIERNLEKIGPWTDFYALGATLYNLLSGKKPPLPSDVLYDETPDKSKSLPMPASVSSNMKALVVWFMQGNIARRPQSVEEIYAYMKEKFPENTKPASITEDEENDGTVLDNQPKPKPASKPGTSPKPKTSPKKVKDENETDESSEASVEAAPGKGKGDNKLKTIVGIVAVAVVAFLVVMFILKGKNSSDSTDPTTDSTSVAADSAAADTLSNDSEIKLSHGIGGGWTKPVDEKDLKPSKDNRKNTGAPQNNRNVKEVDDDKPTPVTSKPQAEKSQPTSGTLSMGYGTWSGGISGGKPDGHGRLTFHSSHAVDRSSSVVANAGDYFIATYDRGILISGKLYDSSGNLLKTIIP